MSRPLAIGFDYPLPAPGAALRRGHWSTEGLKVLLLPNTGSPTVPVYDYARNLWTPHTTAVQAAGNTPTRHGLMRFEATNAGLEIAADATTVVPTTRITILLVKRNTDTTLRFTTAFGIDTGTVAGFCEAYLPHSDGNAYFEFGGVGFTNFIGPVAYGTLTTAPDVWAFTAGQQLRMYRNGVLIASGGPSSVAIPLQQFAVPFLLNNGANGGNTTGGLTEVSFFSVLDAEWNASQVAAWTAKQDLMFERPHVELFDVVSAGAFLAHRAFRSNVAVQRSHRW